ncbi:hypothetical protein DMUE_5591 [Dictyocoela muelleri]|nr:hypothetical protein DMUE_5591 [Dictyocoela muelleri]
MPDNLKVDFQGNLFLHFDSGNNNNERFVIFSLIYKSKYIKKSKICLIDGTFRSTPPGFYQTLFIYSEIFKKFYPVIYTLMTGKTEDLYVRVFEEVKRIFDLNPQYIICDFKLALIKAVKQ